MAKQFKQMVIPADSHKQGTELSDKWKEACLGTLSHGDIYRLGLIAAEMKLLAQKKASQKAMA